MKIYLAGGTTFLTQQNQALDELKREQREIPVNLLWSFYVKNLANMPIKLRKCNVMLDSGAFSFLSKGEHADWDEYVSRYIEYINTNDVKLFFELDIDKIIGYDRVKEIRRRLERETGKRPIPVWHKRLGKEEFLRMCDEYDYVAIGGIVAKEIMVSEYKYLPAFIKAAHKRGSKIHGLGFTHSKWLPICHFDSVDSSAWITGPRYGQVHVFDGRQCCRIERIVDGYRVKTYECAVNNFKEWLKFAAYAETHL